MNKLFAIYLGGEAKGASIEVHDVVFAVGSDIKSTFPQLRDAWFGDKESVHIDSWTEMAHADGYRISLSADPSAGEHKLFFVNIGSYTKQRFGENHHFLFLVGRSAQEAKAKAKAVVAPRHEDLPHTDNLVEIDSLKEITQVSGLHIVLEPDQTHKDLQITNVYWPLSRPEPAAQ